MPFAELLSAAALAQVTPLALEHETVTALTGGALQPLNPAVKAFTCTVNAAGKFVVLKETVVVDGAPVTLPAGLAEVKVTVLGVTLALLTFASRC